MNDIQKTINVCFPRSGHRFLRNICSEYFGDEFKAYRKQSAEFSLEEANYIKNHDFALLKRKPGIPVQNEERYLVQYRHPLESLTSFFEFQVKHGQLNDDRESWEDFFAHHIDYWKLFIDKWCFSTQKNKTLKIIKVNYSDLNLDTFSTAKQVIRFLTNEQVPVDEERLNNSIKKFKSGFHRSKEDEGLGISSTNEVRDIKSFKYFDQKFYELEAELKSKYLEPLGIATILLNEQNEANSLPNQLNYKKIFENKLEDKGDFPDCFAFAMHKAGSSLMHKMIGEVCHAAKIPAITIPDILFGEGVFEKDWGEDKQLLKFIEPGRVYYGFRNLPKVLLDESLHLKEKKSVLLIRDPRDALVSQFYSFGKKDGSHKLPEKNKEVFLAKRMHEEDSAIDEYVISVAKSYLKKLEAYRDNMNLDNLLLIKYEDLYYDKRKWLGEIFKHFNITVDADLLDDIAQKNDIRPDVEDQSKHIRQGTPGDYVNKLKPGTIKELNALFFNVGESFGYKL